MIAVDVVKKRQVSHSAIPRGAYSKYREFVS